MGGVAWYEPVGSCHRAVHEGAPCLVDHQALLLPRCTPEAPTHHLDVQPLHTALVGSGQWAVGSGQWAVGNWAVGNWAVGMGWP